MPNESAPMCTCGRRYEVIEQWGREPACPVATWIPPTKRTNGPCTCLAGNPPLSTGPHAPDCPSLYPVQQEPDALTRLGRIIRQMQEEQLQRRTDVLAEQALALICEAREEHRKSAAIIARAPVAWRISREVRDARYKAEAAIQFMLNGRWGSCSGCPRDPDGFPRPERCANTDRYDHQIDSTKDSEP